MNTKKYISLKVLTTELQNYVEIGVEPRNESEEKAQIALETAEMALKNGVDTEWARTLVIKALELL